MSKKRLILMKSVLSFMLPVIILLVIYWTVGLYPFGNHTVGYGDLTNQYVALVSYFKENIQHPANFLYSFKFSLGGNFFPVFAYYLSSPINLIALLFPVKKILLFFELNILINAGLAGMNMYLYLNNSVWLNKKIAMSKGCVSQAFTLALSTCFSLSAFFFDYSRCVMWFNSVVLLPLVIWGLEKTIFQKRYTLYTVSYTFLLLSNYYIGFMVTLFLLIIVLFWIINDLWVDKKKLLFVFHDACTVLWHSILPLMISAIFIIPSMLAQKNVDQDSLKFSFQRIYKFGDLFPAMFPNIRPANVPIIFTSVLTLLLVVQYFVSKKIVVSGREKFLSISFLLLLLGSTYFKAPYMIWHAFTMPNGYPNRESFVVVFSLVVLAYRGIQAYLFKGDLIQFILGILVFFVVLGYSLANTKCFSLKLIARIILIAFLYCSILFLSHKNGGKLFRLALSLGTVVLLTFDISSGNSKQTAYLARFSTNFDAHQRVISKNKKIIDTIERKDKGFYRIATTYQINPNDPLQFNYNGMQNYLSQQSTGLTNFLSMAGYFQKHSWLRWSTYNNGSTKAMDSLLGIKYVVTNTSPQFLRDLTNIKSMPSGNILKYHSYGNESFTRENFNVYQNKTVFPLVFLADESNVHHLYSYDPVKNPFNDQNNIFQTLSTTKTKMFNNVDNTTIQRFSNLIDISYLPKSGGQEYLYIPFDINRLHSNTIKVSVNDEIVTRAFGSNLYGENGVISLGEHDKNIRVNVKIIGKNVNQIYYKDPFIAIENDKLLREISTKSKKHVIIDSVRKKVNEVSLRTSALTRNQTLYFTVPFDKGWIAYVDGEKTAVNKSFGALSKINLRKGKHTILLKYHVPGLCLSSILTAIGLILCAITIISKRLKIHRRK